jgi:hypothetical protein
MASIPITGPQVFWKSVWLQFASFWFSGKKPRRMPRRMPRMTLSYPDATTLLMPGRPMTSCRGCGAPTIAKNAPVSSLV